MISLGYLVEFDKKFSFRFTKNGGAPQMFLLGLIQEFLEPDISFKILPRVSKGFYRKFLRGFLHDFFS